MTNAAPVPGGQDEGSATWSVVWGAGLEKVWSRGGVALYPGVPLAVLEGGPKAEVV